MTRMAAIMAFVKGICIAIFLSAIGMDTFNLKWFIALIALSIALNIKELGEKR